MCTFLAFTADIKQSKIDVGRRLEGGVGMAKLVGCPLARYMFLIAKQLFSISIVNPTNYSP